MVYLQCIAGMSKTLHILIALKVFPVRTISTIKIWHDSSHHQLCAHFLQHPEMHTERLFRHRAFRFLTRLWKDTFARSQLVHTENHARTLKFTSMRCRTANNTNQIALIATPRKLLVVWHAKCSLFSGD
jgi:hypothetical protein